jgi:hypothetical protein
LALFSPLEAPGGFSAALIFLVRVARLARRAWCELGEKSGENACFLQTGEGGSRSKKRGIGKNARPPLKGVQVNVIYPAYQAAELFGRQKRGVSSTDHQFGPAREKPARSRWFLVPSGGVSDS